MNIFKCRWCGQKINKFYYSNALFCSDFCRKKAYDVRKGRTRNIDDLKFVEGVVDNGLMSSPNQNSRDNT